jgi:hypothetical protein
MPKETEIKVTASGDKINTLNRAHPLPLYLFQWKIPSTLITTCQLSIILAATIIGLQKGKEGSLFRLLEAAPVILCITVIWLYDYENASSPICQRCGVCKNPHRMCMMLPMTAFKLLLPVITPHLHPVPILRRIPRSNELIRYYPTYHPVPIHNLRIHCGKIFIRGDGSGYSYGGGGKCAD